MSTLEGVCTADPPALRHRCPLDSRIPAWEPQSVSLEDQGREDVIAARRATCGVCEHKIKPPVHVAAEAVPGVECPTCGGRLCCGRDVCERCGWMVGTKAD